MPPVSSLLQKMNLGKRRVAVIQREVASKSKLPITLLVVCQFATFLWTLELGVVVKAGGEWADREAGTTCLDHCKREYQYSGIYHDRGDQQKFLTKWAALDVM